MRFIGRRAAPVPTELIERMEWAEGVTRDNRRITLFVAFNYGGRAEIVDAARTFTGEDEDRVPRPPVRARHARPGPDHPHERRAADLELPAVAGGLLGARVSRRAVARFLVARRSSRASRSSRLAGAGSGGADAAGHAGRARRSARAPAQDRRAALRPARRAFWSRSPPRSSRHLHRPRRARVRAVHGRDRRVFACTSCTGCSAAGGRCRWSGSRRSRGWCSPPATAASGSCSRWRCGSVPVLFLFVLARGQHGPRPSRSPARCSASSGSASRSRTPCCCAELPHGNGVLIDVLDRHVPRRHRRLHWRTAVRPPAAGACRSRRTRRSRVCSAGC